jgi:organic hydroperoxide reductase OsmC/OhrA
VTGTMAYALASSKIVMSVRAVSGRRIAGLPNRIQDSSTSVDQPSPSNSRLPPVMFAMAYCACFGSVAAFQAKVASTAYSGKTAIKARIETASAGGISISAASTIQERTNAAPSTLRPARVATIGSLGCVPLTAHQDQGILTAMATTKLTQFMNDFAGFGVAVFCTTMI